VNVPVLHYAPSPPSKLRRILAISLVLPLAAWIGWKVTRFAWTEHRLRREAAMLLTANAPTQFWKSGDDIALAPDATLTLPDGRVGQLIEMAPRDPRQVFRPPNPDVAVRGALNRLRATEIGCRVVGTSPQGWPLVQIWVRSPVAYGGMCGNSSWAERRRGTMLVWRNLGVSMAERSEIIGTAQADRTPVSVLGY